MIKINLLSPEKKDISTITETASFVDEPRESKLSMVAVVGALVLTAAVIAFFYFTQQADLNNKRKTYRIKKARKAELQEVLKKIATLERTRDELARKVKIIEDLKSTQKRTVKMMDQLSSSLPEWVWLTSLTFNNNAINLRGRALSNSLIADFINNLKATNYFHNIQFRDSKVSRRGGLEVLDFRLTCSFRDTLNKKKAG
jgi:Tfp pilus assembly protein PilN